MLSALTKAIAQCADPAFRGVLLRAVAASMAVFALLWAGAWYGLDWTGAVLAEWLAAQQVDGAWTDAVEWVFGAVAVAGVVVVSFLLFPAVIGLVLGFQLEDIAAAVERRYYPDLPPARAQPVGEVFRESLSFVLITLLINFVALPLYLVLLFLPPFNFFVFYGINGYLLGREYFELVGVRRLEAQVAKRLRRRYRGTVFLAGVIIAFLLTIPLVNMVTPIVATAFMLHVFEGVRRRGGAAAMGT